MKLAHEFNNVTGHVENQTATISYDNRDWDFKDSKGKHVTTHHNSDYVQALYYEGDFLCWNGTVVNMDNTIARHTDIQATSSKP